MKSYVSAGRSPDELEIIGSLFIAGYPSSSF